MASPEIGIDFRLINYTDENGNLLVDIDLFDLLEDDPSIVLTSSLAKIFAEPGDYDWDDAQLNGAGLVSFKGKAYTSGDIERLKLSINNQSVEDDRIDDVKTELYITDGGELNMIHKIRVGGDYIQAGATVGNTTSFRI
jgi:hypothetical protein